MNILSKYKFVDECKDVFDQIVSLIDLQGDLQDFKDKFFDQVGALTLKHMLESLNEFEKELALKALRSSSLIEVNENFITRFSETSIMKFYKSSFKSIVIRAFRTSNLASIQNELDGLLKLIDSN